MQNTGLNVYGLIRTATNENMGAIDNAWYFHLFSSFQTGVHSPINTLFTTTKWWLLRMRWYYMRNASYPRIILVMFKHSSIIAC